MKRFFQKRNEDSSGPSTDEKVAATSSTQPSSESMPSRLHRMQLLKSIIHHADAVQRMYLVPKLAQYNTKQDKSNNLFGNDSAEVNNKCYQRWHEILQEGLVPLSVRALNLLEKTGPSFDERIANHEEEEYFSTLEGMEEEIQVMAILARAAALKDEDDSDGNANDRFGVEYMEQINCTMKCIAILLFHVVLESSSLESLDHNGKPSDATIKTVPGYDGRVRHVMKMACVDNLCRAILSSVEAYELKSVGGGTDEGTKQSQQTEGRWDIHKIKRFLDLKDLGRDAIFGTTWKPSESKDSILQMQRDDGKNKNSLLQGNGSLSEIKNEESRSQVQEREQEQEQEQTSDQTSKNNLLNAYLEVESNGLDVDRNRMKDCREIGTDAQSKRLLNAKFLSTRKFELIERLVAIDIVRFLMAKDREVKLRDQKKEEQKKILPKLPLFLRNSIAEEDPDLSVYDERSHENEGDQSNINEHLNENGNSFYFTSSRIQRIKRGAKIATAGLAIGTVFAITGGLAAPALAASIGGIAALTGATTSTSTALLAVLATFKAGALLFGAGGGGIAAYKMKKRTAGLSQFEVRRENIEQYMYEGASEEKMKKGIAAMLPQLHTTVAVTGWLREHDVADYQLAWGCQPTCAYEHADDFSVRIRQLRRFYAIFNPSLVPLCEDYMMTLKSRMKKDFSWDRIWMQLEEKYGTNPDHMIPVDTPRHNEVFLSCNEKAMIDGVLNTAKMANLKKRGLGTGEDFNETDEIADLLAQATTANEPSKIVSSGIETFTRLDEYDQDQPVSTGSPSLSQSRTKSLQERMSSQRNDQVVFLKKEGLIDNDDDLKGGVGLSNMTNEADDIEDKDRIEVRCPLVWDWNRLYATDIHTVTWESKMLSSLCHIVENMAIEVSTQATKVALQYSVIGAIVSAVAIPSALLTATKLIDDPYQIVILRADQAGRELGKCTSLLTS